MLISCVNLEVLPADLYLSGFEIMSKRIYGLRGVCCKLSLGETGGMFACGPVVSWFRHFSSAKLQRTPKPYICTPLLAIA